MSKFSIVSTPIGNLGDISNRAINTLKEAHIILCEDTRVTKKLLNHFDIPVKTISYHSHSDETKINQIFSLIKEQKNIALVSDAGTPTISDPGAPLIRSIRENFKEEIVKGDLKIEIIPGPSALIAALALSGISSSEFHFYGFVPHKKGRETMIRNMIESAGTSICYESVHRILKFLDLFSVISKVKSVNRNLSVCRELTKIHEEVIQGNVEEIISVLKNNPEKIHGEFVVIVHSL
jgi:16S rRNA (cytidine1402-2'-O)-methyltransferase